MSRISESALDRYPVPLASVLAVLAAVLLLTVWEPIQQRSLSEGIRAEQHAAATQRPAWLDASFTTSEGSTSSLSASNGHVRIVTMMYAHCPGICPMNIATLRQIESHLSTTERDHLRIVALTLDPQRDSQAELVKFRQTHGINSVGWTLGRPSTSAVAQLAAGVGITYRALPDGSVDHQSTFVLLDESGHILARTSNTRNPDAQFVTALRRALQD